MFEYDICNVYDKDIFDRQCGALEKHIPGLEKQPSLVDVDSTVIQVYMLSDKKLKVTNDTRLGVAVQSEFDIEPYFKKD